MIKMCRYALVTALAIFLAGCVGPGQQPAPVEEAQPKPQQPVQPQPTVPSIPVIPTQPGPIEHGEEPAQPALACVIMTGAAQCSRWLDKCCKRVA